MKKEHKIFIAGHKGMVGSSLVRLLKKRGFENLVLKSKDELNLLDQKAVYDFMHFEKPSIVVIAAARVGGINANMKRPADFLFENLQIQNNLIDSSANNNVEKVIFLGSSCIYPKECPQPMKEEYLLTGKLEDTNEGYAIAKIAGLKMLEYYKRQKGLDYLSLMPCNLYGPNDSFDLEHSHVLSALVKKFSDAVSNGSKEILLWGTGIARREFMHVDDLANAILYFSNNNKIDSFLNIGWGTDVTIKELAQIIAKKTGFDGTIKWDSDKPDGMLKKCMDVSKMKEMGFQPKITLEEGIIEMIDIYKKLK